jgi:TolB protein
MLERRKLGAIGAALCVATLAACHKYVSVEDQQAIAEGRAPSSTGAGASEPMGHGAEIVERDEENQRAREKLSVTGAGSALERVTTDPVDEFAPAVSRDGKKLLIQVETYDPDTSPPKLKQQTIVGVDPNTRGQRTLYTSASRFSSNPTWMPDGSSYVYVTNSMGPYAIVRALTAAPNAAIAVILSSDIAPQPSHPTVSPDGLRIAFSTTSTDGVHSVCTVGTDGSEFTVLGEGRSPAYSPDGSSIAFVRNVNGFDHIFVVDARKGTNLVELTGGGSDNEAPSWSPDGQYVAFASNRGYEELGKKREEVLHIFVMKKDGTGLVQLTNGQSIGGAPTWGGDGWVYFSSNQSGNYDIWRIKLAGDLADLVMAKPPSGATDADKGKDGKSVDEPKPPQDFPVSVGCQTDRDCKGDRVCEYGQCVLPEVKPPPAPPPPPPPPPPTTTPSWQQKKK